MGSAHQILLVEPNKLFAEKIKKALELNNFKVKVCASAEAAIHSADEAKPDLVVLELALTGHNGIEFLYEFRSYDDWADTPVIIYSSVPPGRFKLMAKQLRLLGINEYFDKTKTSLSELVGAVARELKDAAASH